MAKNQSTYTLKIDAELGNLQKTLNEAKNSLSSFMASGNAPKGLEKAFEKISDLLGQITDKAGKPLDLKGLNAAGKDLDSVQESFRAIIRLLGEFDDLSDDIKLSFLSPDEQKKIQDATKALQTYGKSMEEVAKKQKSLDAMQKAGQKNQTALDKAKKKVGGLQDEKTLTQAKLSGAQTKLNAARGMENANPKDIAKYEAEIEKLTAELTILDKNLGAANEELTTAQNAYNSSAQSIKKMEAEIKRASGASLKQLKEEATALGISLEGLNGHDAAAQVEILTNRLEEFKKEAMNGARPAFEAIKRGCEGAEKAADGLQDELKEAVESTKAMDEAAAQRDAFEAKIKSFLGLSGAAQVLRAALRDAMQTITELDAVMGQMAVVTDLTVGDYWDQLPEYSERASKLGVSITSAYEAATLYYQQGLKANEVTALSEQTLKMAAIAGLDAADATDRMTAALRGFNMELNEANAQNIADVYSELAAITAADVDEISTAMTKTASIASSAGMEFETTAAFLSQIIETTRESAETAGTAMKTVIARFQELKKDPSEIGEVEGEIVDANAIETALRSVGVSLRDSAGQFRELDEVFLELSSKWDELDKNTQRYIATIAAGSRQQSRFIAMMSDYKRTTELVTAANTSAGASNKQFEKTMDTLEYKINQLKNAWHEFTMGIMNSDLVKTGVDILTKFLNIVNKATSGLDGIRGSLVKIASIITVFNIGKILYNKISGPITNFFLSTLPKLAYDSGFKSGENYVKGNKDGATNQTLATEEPQEQQGFWSKAVGSKSWQQAWKSHENTNFQRDVLKLMEQEGGDLKSRKAALARAKQKRATALLSGGENSAAVVAQTNDEIDKATKALEEYKAQQKDVYASSKETWQHIGDGISSVAQSTVTLGVSVSMLGGLLSSMGLEGLGDTLVSVGNAVTFVGSALSVIPPILTLISSHPIVAIVVAALALILAGVMALVNAWKKNTPEAKLKAAQEAAEKAAEAADRAKEAYEGLASAFESLNDKYDAFKDLTKGTKEWNKAVLETNSAVMDLIDKYPDLAKFVENIDGILTIDFDNKEVQDVLNKTYYDSIGADNVKYAADINTNKAELNTKRSILDTSGLTFDVGNLSGRINDLETEFNTINDQIFDGLNFRKGVTVAEREAIIKEQLNPLAKEIVELSEIRDSIINNGTITDQQIDLLAKGLAQGNVWLDTDGVLQATSDIRQELKLTDYEFEALSKAVKENQKQLMSYGLEMYNTEEKNKNLYDAMANSVLSLVDTLGMSEERVQQMFNIADGDNYKKSYEFMEKMMQNADAKQDDSGEDWHESIEKATGGIADEDYVNKALHHAGYTNATLGENGKVTYTKDGEQTKTTLTEDEIRRAVSTYYADVTTQQQAEYTGEYISQMSKLVGEKYGDEVGVAFSKAMQNETGANLTANDLSLLEGIDAKALKDVFEELPDTLKEVFRSANVTIDKFNSAKIGAAGTGRSGFNEVDTGAMRALTKITSNMANEATKNEFKKQFNNIMGDLQKQEEKDLFSQTIASLSSDPTNKEAWDAALEKLEAYGINAETFVETWSTELDARYSSKFLEGMGVSQNLISQYEQAEDVSRFHATFKKWKKDYDTANDEQAKAENELIGKTVEAIIDNREKQIDAYEEAVNAEAEANGNLLSKISNNVARLRELREKEETEKAISENLSKQAYLGMDTSGGNALEILQLQEENTQMVQDYEDQLVDQAITRLEEDNDKALQQREKQIELMREQLKSYSNSQEILAEANQYIKEAKDQLLGGGNLSGTALYNLLKPVLFKSDQEEAQFNTELNGLVSEAIGGGSSGGTGGSGGSTIDSVQEGLALGALTTLSRNANAKQNAAEGSQWNKSEDYKAARQQYIDAHGGDISKGAAFDIIAEEEAKKNINSGSIDNVSVSDLNSYGWYTGDYDQIKVALGKTTYTLQVSHSENNGVESGIKDSLNAIVGTPKDGWIAMSEGKPYIYIGGNRNNWYPISEEGDYSTFTDAYLKKIRGYKTGGLASFTGPAWLDGTPSKPEYVLNAEQTERFFSLIDVLEGIDTNEASAKSSGDNYFDINIQVEKLDDDYDVERMADKIRRMIYDDATYRNVNAINHIR